MYHYPKNIGRGVWDLEPGRQIEGVRPPPPPPLPPLKQFFYTNLGILVGGNCHKFRLRKDKCFVSTSAV